MFFLTFSWRFLRSNELEQLEFKSEKTGGRYQRRWNFSHFKIRPSPYATALLGRRYHLTGINRWSDSIDYRIEIEPYLLRSRRVFPGLPSRFSSKKLEGLSLRSDVATGGGEISAISKFCPG